MSDDEKEKGGYKSSQEVVGKIKKAEFDSTVRARGQVEKRLLGLGDLTKKFLQGILDTATVYVATSGYIVTQVSIEGAMSGFSPEERAALEVQTRPWPMLKTMGLVDRDRNFPGSDSARFDCRTSAIIAAVVNYGGDLENSNFGKQLAQPRFGLVVKKEDSAKLRKTVDDNRYPQLTEDKEVAKKSTSLSGGGGWGWGGGRGGGAPKK